MNFIFIIGMKPPVASDVAVLGGSNELPRARIGNNNNNNNNLCVIFVVFEYYQNALSPGSVDIVLIRFLFTPAISQ